MVVDTQLPTPPEDNKRPIDFSPIQGTVPFSTLTPRWPESPNQSLYDETQDEVLDNTLAPASSAYDYPDLSGKASPTSSNEALPDQDEEIEGLWNSQHDGIPLTMDINRRSLSTDSMGCGTPEAASSSSTSLSSTLHLEGPQGRSTACLEESSKNHILESNDGER